jgi:hypothetical protein
LDFPAYSSKIRRHFGVFPRILSTISLLWRRSQCLSYEGGNGDIFYLGLKPMQLGEKLTNFKNISLAEEHN